MSDRHKTTDGAYSVGWVDGRRRAYLDMLATALKGLGMDAPEEAKLSAERADAVAALRRLCAEHGDNEWPDDLHLADVIDKHLAPYLDKDDADAE